MTDEEERVGEMTSDAIEEVVPKVVTRKPHLTVRTGGDGE